VFRIWGLEFRIQGSQPAIRENVSLVALGMVGGLLETLGMKSHTRGNKFQEWQYHTVDYAGFVPLDFEGCDVNCTT